MSPSFITPQNPRLWLVIWRALAAALAGCSPQAVTLAQFRASTRGWSYEGSYSNVHYFKHRSGRRARQITTVSHA